MKAPARGMKAPPKGQKTAAQQRRANRGNVPGVLGMEEMAKLMAPATAARWVDKWVEHAHHDGSVRSWDHIDCMYRIVPRHSHFLCQRYGQISKAFVEFARRQTLEAAIEACDAHQLNHRSTAAFDPNFNPLDHEQTK